MSQLPEPPSEPKQAISTPETQTVSVNVSMLVAICAVGLLLCFFLPWIDFLGAKASGLDIAKNKGESKVVWLVPLLSFITIIAGLTKKIQIAKTRPTANPLSNKLPTLTTTSAIATGSR